MVCMGVEPSHRFKPEACERCGLVTRDLKQVEIDGKWYYACPRCRGLKAPDERESRRERLKKLYEKELR